MKKRANHRKDNKPQNGTNITWAVVTKRGGMSVKKKKGGKVKMVKGIKLGQQQKGRHWRRDIRTPP